MTISFLRISLGVGTRALFTAIPVALLFPIAGRVRHRPIPGTW
jgi:hypothetical protein